MSTDDGFLSSYREDIESDAKSKLEVSEKADIWGFEFLEKYVEIGDTHSFENNHLHVGMVLALVSQSVGDSHFYVNQGKQSTRVHPLIIQGSGTGKDPAYTLAKIIAREAGLQWHSVSDLTNAGIVGTFDGDEEKAGLAERADIIGFREATSLFRSAEQTHSQTLGENLNSIMDGQRITREMAGGTKSFKPSCTLVGTTYPPKDLDLERLMNNGTLARFFYFFKPVDEEFRFQMSRRIEDESIGEPTPEEQKETIESLATTLQVIKQEFEGGQDFRISQSVKSVDVTGTIRDILEEYDDTTQSIVQPAITRYVVHHRRLSCLMAALNHCSTVVRREHAEDALRLIKESWRNMLEFYSHHYSTPSGDTATSAEKSQLEILKSLSKSNGLSQSELADETGISKRTIRKHVKTMESEGYLRVEKSGREKRYFVGEGS